VRAFEAGGNIFLSLLCRLQGLDEGHVLKERDFGLLELGKDFIFKRFELVLALLDLVDQLILVLLKRGLLFLHDDTETLLLKTLLLNGEVDNVDLGGDLGRVVWVAHSCRDVQHELRVVCHQVVADLDLQLGADSLEEGLVEDVVKGGVERLHDVLQEDCLAGGHALGHLLNQLFVVDVKDYEVLAMHLLDPGVSLGLRVDVKGPSIALGNKNTVLSGEQIDG